MPTTTGKNAAVKHNGGTVFYGGTVGSNRTFISLMLPYIGLPQTSTNIQIPPATNGLGPTAKGLNSGSYAVMKSGKYVVMRMCTELANVSNTTLQTGAAEFSNGRGGHNNFFTGTVRTQRYIITGGWNAVTGRPIGMVQAADSIPNETFPTRAVPGKLVYMVTGTTAKVDSYKADTL